MFFVSKGSDKTSQRQRRTATPHGYRHNFGAALAAVAFTFGTANASPLNGETDITVAVVDTGADLSHPLLQDSLWTNVGETGKDPFGRDRASNRIDDDGNGYVDDVHGWDFTSAGPDVTDNDGHGTHIAGLVKSLSEAFSARAQESAWVRPKLMTLKYFDARKRGLSPLPHLISAIRYAVKMQAQIINISGGGRNFNADEFAAIREAESRGILVVAASGNKKAGDPNAPFFPAGYGLPNILSVTATDAEGSILATSNFDPRLAELAAPGLRLRSALPQGRFGALTGSSQAAAVVSGAAAYIAGAKKPKNVGELKQAILALGTKPVANADGSLTRPLALDLSRVLDPQRALDLGLVPLAKRVTPSQAVSRAPSRESIEL